jgi:hypothetical protein
MPHFTDASQRDEGSASGPSSLKVWALSLGPIVASDLWETVGTGRAKAFLPRAVMSTGPGTETNKVHW